MDTDLLNLILNRIKLLGDPFYRMDRESWAFRDAYWHFMRMVGNRIYDTRHILIPGRINAAVLSVVTYVNSEVRRVWTELLALFAHLNRTIERYIAQDRARMDAIDRRITSDITTVWATLRPVAALVRALLTSPERMAEWLVAAMVRRVMIYIRENGERILLWLFRSSPRAMLALAVEIEKLIVRVL